MLTVEPHQKGQIGNGREPIHLKNTTLRVSEHHFNGSHRPSRPSPPEVRPAPSEGARPEGRRPTASQVAWRCSGGCARGTTKPARNPPCLGFASEGSSDPSPAGGVTKKKKSVEESSGLEGCGCVCVCGVLRLISRETERNTTIVHPPPRFLTHTHF